MILAIHLGTTALFILLGALLSCGKGAWLIAGYNTAPKREKEKYDQKALCRGTGRLMFLLAACWLVVASSEIFHAQALLWIGPALFMLAVIGGVVYMNTGKRYQKKL